MPTGRLTQSYRSSTTQGQKGWEAIAKENQQFFLPISPTDPNDRPVLKVKVDYDQRFVGKSLLYLCIEVDILASDLQSERCMGYLDPSAVEIIQRERSLIHAVESAGRENMREERMIFPLKPAAKHRPSGALDIQSEI